jgi:hypothetical protein
MPLEPILSPDDPRLRGMGDENVAGADQIGRLLAASADERLQYLVDMLRFEAEARSARLWPLKR